jgi:hypothetical protein
MPRRVLVALSLVSLVACNRIADPISALDGGPAPATALINPLPIAADPFTPVFTLVAPGVFEVLPATCNHPGDFEPEVMPARILPAYGDGRAIGIRLFSIRKGSFYDKAGFQNGDIVERVNDFELSPPNQLLEAYTRLKAVKTVRFELLRNGEPLVQTYHLKN